MNRGVLNYSILILLVLIFSFLVNADVSKADINIDGKDYNIALSDIFSDSVEITVNEYTGLLDNEQTESPYILQTFDPEISELKYVLKKIQYSSQSPYLSRAEAFILFEKILSEDMPYINLTLNGKKYVIEMEMISLDSIILSVNGQARTLSPPQVSGPYSIGSFYTETPELKHIFLDVDYTTNPSFFSSAIVILGFDLNFSLEECIEDWSCTDWSECSNEEKNRTCTDKNVCATTKSKPIETKSCLAPEPQIDCNNDNDCATLGMGSPECKGDKVCISSMNYECLNAGTEESYCSYPTSEQCTVCEYGCSDNKCLRETDSESTTETKNECEQIGIRQNGRYCSREYKLISQRTDKTQCENNFECKSNICQNNKCVGQESSSLKPGMQKNIFYGIIVGIFLIGLLVISLIIFFLKRSRAY